VDENAVYQATAKAPPTFGDLASHIFHTRILKVSVLHFVTDTYVSGGIKDSKRETCGSLTCSVVCGRFFPVVAAFTVDYLEAAIWNALRNKLPDATIKGCMFHFRQAIWPKIQDIGLQRAYCEKRKLHRLINVTCYFLVV